MAIGKEPAINGGDDDWSAALNAELGLEADAPETEIGESDDSAEADELEAAAHAAGDDRPRDEKGRFAPKEQGPEAPAVLTDKQASQPVAPAPVEPQQQPVVGAEQAQAPAHRPPPGWSVAAKAEFDKLPPSVREAVANREAEVDRGFARYKGLGEYAELAERNGTSLANAVRDYHGVESALRKDFIGGIEAVCQRFGVDPRSLNQALSVRYGGADQQYANQSQQQAYQQPTLDPNAIVQQVEQRLQRQLEDREINAEIERFANDPANRFYSNVEAMLPGIIQTIRAASPHLSRLDNLKQAYERACWAHPEVREVLMTERSASAVNPIQKKADAANQARAASKSIKGAPTPGARPPGQTNAQTSIEDDLRAAWDEAS